jgi:hypothetical protein
MERRSPIFSVRRPPLRCDDAKGRLNYAQVLKGELGTGAESRAEAGERVE